MNLLFVDTETSGFAKFSLPADDPTQPHLVQLAAILTDPTGRPLNTFGLLIKPEGWEIPAEATAVHNITTAMCHEHGVKLAGAVNLLLRLLTGNVTMVAHNLRFDQMVLRTAVARSGCAWPEVPTYCTMLAATPIVGLPNPNGRRGNKWPQLKEAYRHFTGKEPEVTHDALADVRSCMEVFFKLNPPDRVVPERVPAVNWEGDGSGD